MLLNRFAVIYDLERLTPKALYSKAQGCPATLGKKREFINPERVEQIADKQ